MPTRRVVLDIPHGGKKNPSEEIKSELHPDITKGDLMREADLYSTGFYFDQQDVSSVNKIMMDQLRAIVDVNRDLDNFTGNGIVKTRTSRGKQIYKSPLGLSRRQRAALIEGYAKPYMGKLQRAVEKRETGLVMLCHTMDPIAPAILSGAGTKRPLITLANGGDELGNPEPDKPYQLPRDLMEQVRAEIESRIGELDLNRVIYNGKIVSFNKPYSGRKSIDRIGPNRLQGRKAFMMEVNKSLVMDFETLNVTHSANIGRIREIIGSVIENVLKKI